MFYEIKTTSSMAKIRKSDASVTSLIDVFGKEYLLQEDKTPLALCLFDADGGFDWQSEPIAPDNTPRILHSSEKRLSALLSASESVVSVSYTVDEDGLGVSFMADGVQGGEKKLCVCVNLISFSHTGDGSDYRMISSGDNKTVTPLLKASDAPLSEIRAQHVKDGSFEISSCFNGHGAEFKLTGEWEVYAVADEKSLKVALIPTDTDEQLTFKLNMV